MKYLDYFYGNDVDAFLGYAYTAKMMIGAFERNGVTLTEEAETVLVHSVPWHGFEWGSNQRAGIFSMWEFVEIPPVIRTGLVPFDFALAPCTYSAELFAPYVEESFVCPHGIDADHYKPNPDFKREDSRFTVISSATNRRKGAEELVDAFERAAIPDSRLILKGQRNAVGRSLPSNVEFWDFPLEDMRDWYHQADLYVSCSHGEGWDLIAWEALACGVPTIVPAHTAYLDWMHFAQDTTERWSVQRRDLSPAGRVGIRECDRMEVAEKLNVAYKNIDTYKDSALRSSNDIRTEHTWDQEVARLLPDFVDLSASGNPGENIEHELLVPILCKRFVDVCDIGLARVGPFYPDNTYWLDGDQSRVLMDSGYVEFNEPALKELEKV